jgi:hypothetical protein
MAAPISLFIDGCPYLQNSVFNMLLSCSIAPRLNRIDWLFLPHIFLVRRFSCPPSLWRSGGVAGLPAVFVAGWNEIFGEEVICQE